MVAQQFGSAHTEKKLRAVQNYLNAFTTALKKQSFELLYVDACAGSGASMARKPAGQAQFLEADEVTVGSAVRALQISTPFDRYIFNDTKLKNVRSLASVVDEQFPLLRERVTIMRSDANQVVTQLARQTNWKRTRAVVFLDPFGLQMKFSMVEELARTGAVDLWYLIPVFAMSRQVKGDGSILEPGGTLVDDLLGTDAWRQGITAEEASPEIHDLFGPVAPSIKKVANAAWFEQVAMRQLRSVFAGGVLETALPLGRGGHHEFSLVFACANPRSSANTLAKRLAAAVLK